MDLPVWQELREELHPQGLEIVTVGLDTSGAESCRPFIEAANATHPSLVDVGHRMAELFGVVNIPNGVWIDEQGVIVRPAEPAFPRNREGEVQIPEGLPERITAIIAEASKIKPDGDRYVAALRDWVAKGSDSTFALSPDEVMARSGRRDLSVAAAAAHFALGQHLWRSGEEAGGVRHFREAHRLHPENIAYKRQAWSLASPGTGPLDRYWQGPVAGREDEWPYESDWLSEVKAMGIENYYPPLAL